MSAPSSGNLRKCAIRLVRRALAETNPEAFLGDVATTLNNLAALYSNIGRMDEAEQFYQRALSIRRTLAATNPEAYQCQVGSTISNLAAFYRDRQRLSEAERLSVEAHNILEPLWRENPEFVGDRMARVHVLRAELAGGDGHTIQACALARQACAAAHDPELKQVAQNLVDQFCAQPSQ